MNVALVQCLYCFQPVELVVDPFGGRRQEYVEDCPVCCRPWRVLVTIESGREPSVRIEKNA